MAGIKTQPSFDRMNQDTFEIRSLPGQAGFELKASFGD